MRTQRGKNRQRRGFGDPFGHPVASASPNDPGARIWDGVRPRTADRPKTAFTTSQIRRCLPWIPPIANARPPIDAGIPESFRDHGVIVDMDEICHDSCLAFVCDDLEGAPPRQRGFPTLGMPCNGHEETALGNGSADKAFGHGSESYSSRSRAAPARRISSQAHSKRLNI